jgi:hypothetical protein
VNLGDSTAVGILRNNSLLSQADVQAAEEGGGVGEGSIFWNVSNIKYAFEENVQIGKVGDKF